MDIEHNKWENILVAQVPGTTPIDKQFWRLLPNKAHLLEVGVGSGRIIGKCLDLGYQVTGIDINSSAVEKLKTDPRIQSTQTEIYLESVTNTHFSQETFRGVLLQGVLSALSPADRLLAMAELYRIVTIGGLLHIAEFEQMCDFLSRQRYEDDISVTGEYGTLAVRDDGGSILFHSHNFLLEELIDLIEDNGFRGVSFKQEDFTSYHGNIKPGMLFIAERVSL